MIVPEGTRLVLDTKDEFNHEPEPVSNYNESMYFNAFDTAAPFGLWMRIGNRPNEGYAEVSCCIYLPDGRAAFIHVKPEITDNVALNAGGMTFQIVEPFKRFSIRYDGKVLLLNNPFEMADPGAAFKNNPKVLCKIDIEVTGISPMHGGEIVNLDGSPAALNPDTAVFRGHTEQHTWCRGNITVEEQTMSIDGPGFRDKSWGPRHWQSFYWYKWLPVTFNRGFGIMLALMGRADGPPFVNGHVYHDGVLTPLVEGTIDVDWDTNHYQKSFVASLTTEHGEYLLEGETVCLVPLRHRRALADGSVQIARITEGMTRYRCNGSVTYGMSEFLDLMVNGLPISISDTTVS